MTKDVTEYSSYKRLDSTNRILALSGVPLNLLTKKSDIDSLNYKTVTYKSKIAGDNDPPIHITDAQQTQYLEQLIEHSALLGSALTMGIGGFPSDQPASDLAVMLCRMYYDVKKSKENAIPFVKWIDLAYPDWDFLNTFDKTTALVVVSGMADNSEAKRLERAKDFIRKAEGTTCIYISHTTNIIEFSFEKLGITPDSVFQLGRTVKGRAIR